MRDEIDFWRLDKAAKVESVVRDINPLIRRARAAGLSVTAYLLEQAAEEARKELSSSLPTPVWRGPPCSTRSGASSSPFSVARRQSGRSRRARSRPSRLSPLVYDATPGEATPFVAAFQRGLAEVGFVEGQNVAVEYRYVKLCGRDAARLSSTFRETLSVYPQSFSPSCTQGSPTDRRIKYEGEHRTWRRRGGLGGPCTFDTTRPASTCRCDD